MSKQNIKEKIITTAWELFYRKGFEETTLNDIIEEAGIAKGTFYYYFRSKDTLLNTLSVILDEKYRELERELPEGMDEFDQLIELNYRIHTFMGEHIDHSLLANQYASQLIAGEESNLLDKNRYYFTLVTRIVEEGQRNGAIINTRSVREIVAFYSLCERALVTDWCMNKGEYSLGEVSRDYMPMMFSGMRGKHV
ncbi:MAG: TetR/AcrR family transcriptional regulator [Mogibacterium sp.]|nr:TetR/AcrR family transcriptional regulator [Mogibacterium sp.]